MNHRLLLHPRPVRGSALAPVLVLLLLCSALAASVIVVQTSSKQEVGSRLDSERAFQMAEAGIDWCLATIRERDGALPSPATQTHSPHPSGSFTFSIEPGDSNGRDDDGDGDIDDDEEAIYQVLLSTGRSGNMERTIEVTIKQELDVPAFGSALALNNDFPIVEMDGNAFRVNGNDHRINGTQDPSAPSEPGLSTTGDPDFVRAQINTLHADQIDGQGGSPSVYTADPVDIEAMLELAAATAEMRLTEGTYSQLEAGVATPEGMVTVYSPGNLSLSGGAEGAGLLAVNGDLSISGGLEWVGIVLVRGRVTFSGGGGNDRIVGSMVIGEDVTMGGTVDLLYSSSAIELARLRLLYLGVTSWREVATPVPVSP